MVTPTSHRNTRLNTRKSHSDPRRKPANRTGFEASYFRSPASGAPVVPPPVPVPAVRGVPIRRPSSSHTGLPAAKRGFKHIARTVSALRWTMQGLKPRLLCHEVTSQRCPQSSSLGKPCSVWPKRPQKFRLEAKQTGACDSQCMFGSRTDVQRGASGET